MTTARKEHIEFKVYRKKPNSYEYEDFPAFSFFGKIANKGEITKYRVMKGLNTNNIKHYIYATNLVGEINPEDKIKWLDDYFIVESVGYFFENITILNERIMSKAHLFKKCPKGIVIG